MYVLNQSVKPNLKSNPGFMSKNFYNVILIFLSLFINGCSTLACCLTLPVEENGSIHYLVIGLGMVSIPKPNADTAVLATKHQVLGVVVSDQPGAKMGVGYTSGSVVAIPHEAKDVRVEITNSPGGNISITSSSAVLH